MRFSGKTRSPFSLCRLLLCFLAVAAALPSQASAQIKPFTFIHFSDPHIGTAGNEERLQQALADVDKNFPDAALIIVTGDVTEFGFTEEFTSLTRILKTSKRPIYTATGNHDTRWSNSGKENYRAAFNETYKKIDHNGVRFILMDSAMLLEHYGHFDGQQLAQLRQDLDSMTSGMQAVLGMHHPPLSPGHFIDNEYLFADLIGQYPVPLICTGHGHAFQRMEINGTTWAMGGSVSNSGAPPRSYRVYNVTESGMESFTRIYDRDKTEAQKPIVFRDKKPNLELVAADNNQFSVAVDGKPVSGEVAVSLDQVTTQGVQISEKVDLSAYPLATGIHQLVVEAPMDTGTTAVGSLVFESTDDQGSTITRRWPLKSGMQSHPLVDGDVLYAGANDGILRAIDLASPEGKVLWETDLHSEILSAPALTSGTLVVGSMDFHVYGIDPATGKEQWKFKTEQAVLASPLIHDGVVYIGSGDLNMYALDLKTGKKLWSFAAEKLIKATPAIADGKLFFGAWDNFFYCLNAKSGALIWKVPVSTAPNGHFSAATSNPVIHEKNIIVASHDYSVRCLSQATGSSVWVYTPDKPELGPSYSTAIVKDGVAWFGSISGNVVGHDVLNGRKVASINVRPEKKDDLFDSIPVMDGNELFIGSVGGNLYCVDTAQKTVKWSVALQPGFIFTRPALWKDKVIVGTLNDMIYEIQRPAAAGSNNQ